MNDSKKETERLSAIHRKSSSNKNCEMGFGGSDGEDKLRRPTASISKRFKLPRKFFDDCNTVDHASIPRKLRSATKKRNHASISPPLSHKKKKDRVIIGVQLPRKDAIKKSKKSHQQGDLEGSLGQTMEGPITKDEEEVVETLSALSAMFGFPTNEQNDFDCKLVNEKSSPLLEGDIPRPTFQDPTAPEKEEDSNSNCPSTAAEAANSSLLEGSALETLQVECSTKYQNKLDNTISQRNLQPLSLLSKSENIDGKPSWSSVGCKVQSDLSLGSGSKHPKHEEATISTGKPVGFFSKPTTAVSTKHEVQYTLQGRKNSGSALWPGLLSAQSPGSFPQGPTMESSTAKTPGCLHVASSLAQPGSLDNGVLTDKDSIAPVGGKKTWTGCSAHMYICHLIKDLEIAGREDGSPFQPTLLTPNEGSKESGSNGAVSSHTVIAEKNPNEIWNAILLHKRLLQDQQQGPTQKQCFDFLSLSTGSGGLEASNSTNKVGNVPEPLTQFHIPYLNSLVQNQTVLPFSMPQIRFCSTPFADNPPSAATKQVQIPPTPHVGTPLLGHRLGFSASPKQEQQQRIWATQYRPTGVAATHFPNWHDGRYDPYGLHYAQFILPPSHSSSLEVLGPKYSPISQQQLLCHEHL
ncbi:uncharacterized protein LOC131334459 isoform X2 [Rhododendron vialii]|uniref:uncharacterized protein LOC131334459 isoform X2 n=1 Tax=Rhododendron vialii TaxID=182163 RepID=UPI00265EDF9A|nr:uncharacterized protein LOC131334459 isoform X2 [Rhododendron vialii]XP_058225468.1 uncharacterized protein LOC131334459 isoform X2 [Rhododendron vialii]